MTFKKLKRLTNVLLVISLIAFFGGIGMIFYGFYYSTPPADHGMPESIVNVSNTETECFGGITNISPPRANCESELVTKTYVQFADGYRQLIRINREKVEK